MTDRQFSIRTNNEILAKHTDAAGEFDLDAALVEHIGIQVTAILPAIVEELPQDKPVEVYIDGFWLRISCELSHEDEIWFEFCQDEPHNMVISWRKRPRRSKKNRMPYGDVQNELNNQHFFDWVHKVVSFIREQAQQKAKYEEGAGHELLRRISV